MECTIRAATAGDHDRLAEIGAEGDAPGLDAHYLSFVAARGRLLVAASAGDVVAFAGMLPVTGFSPVGDVAMVTDLFVSTEGRGHGVGGALLTALLDGYEQRMTCSSKHPAALPAYRRAGMEPRWRLLYLAGVADGGGPPLTPAPWAGDRPELVQHFADAGAIVVRDAVIEVAGGGADVHRLQAADPIGRMADILAALPAGLPVHTCVPEPHPLAQWLFGRDFEVADHDVFCATPGVMFRGGVSCVHPGLL
jgi:GNAT superfamily N-acetyltransferase